MSNLNQEDIIGIYHVTNIKNLPSILSTGLNHKIDLQSANLRYIRGDNDVIKADIDSSEYPGIFTGIFLKEDIGKRWPPKIIGNMSIPDNNNPYVTLVFSNVLLKQKNYHANLVDNMGYITKETYTHKNIPKFVNKLRKHSFTKKNVFNAAEIVFHDKIDIKSLQEIWTNNITLYNNLKKHIPIIKYVTTIPNKIYNKYSNLSEKKLANIIDLKSKPNFCYYIGSYNKWDYTKYKTEIIKNCGLTAENVQSINLKNKLNSIIKETYKNRKKTNISPLYYPNYNWKISHS